MDRGNETRIDPGAVGRRIAQVRAELNLSLLEVALKAKVTDEFFAKLELGEVDPIEFSALEAVSRALSVSMDRLVTDDSSRDQLLNDTEPQDDDGDPLGTLPQELRELLASDEASGYPQLPQPVLAALSRFSVESHRPATASEWKPIVRGFMRAIGRDYLG